MAAKTGVIYLQKDKFQLYSPFFSTILEFHFVPEIVRDLDVVNKDFLENLLGLFITNNKIPPSNLIVVVADNACFIKDFFSTQQPQPQGDKPPQMPTPQELAEELHDQIEQFVDHVPFDSVVSEKFPLVNGIKVLATNRELYDAIKEVFEKQKFTVEIVVPGLPFGNNASANSTMDFTLANYFLQRVSAMKQYGFAMQNKMVIQERDVAEETPEKSTAEEPEKQPDDPTKPKENKRLFVLVGVFVFLIILTIIVYFMTNQPPPPATPAPGSAAVLPVSPTTPTVLAQQTTFQEDVTPAVPNSEELKMLSVQIINASDSAQPALNLKNQLSVYPFKTIDLQTQTIGAAKGIVIFSGNPSPAVRSFIVTEVTKITGSVSVQQRADAVVDIGIIVGK